MIPALGSVRSDERHLFLGQLEVPGVQDARFEFNNGMSSISALGLIAPRFAPRGLQAGTISVSAMLISDDVFLSFTGASGINAYLIGNDKSSLSPNFSASECYLTSYSARYAVGEVPQIECTFSVYGNMAQFAPNHFPQEFQRDISYLKTGFSNLELKIPGPGTISVNASGIESNRLQSYEIRLECQREPLFEPGNRMPYRVELVHPITARCSFRFDLADMIPQSLKDSPPGQIFDLNIGISGIYPYRGIANYSFSSLQHVSQSIDTNVNGSQSLILEYVGQVAV